MNGAFHSQVSLERHKVKRVIQLYYRILAKKLFGHASDDKSVSYLSQLLLFACLIIALSLGQDFANPALSYQRGAVLSGQQWWRIWTCNLVHLSFNHMLLNLSSLAMLTLLVRHSISDSAWYGCLLICFSSVGFGLLLFDPHIVQYVGLSGSLYGLIVFGLVINFRQSPWLYGIILAYVFYKVISQQITTGGDEDVRKFIGGAIIVKSHLYGLIAGSMMAALYVALQYMQTLRRT